MKKRHCLWAALWVLVLLVSGVATLTGCSSDDEDDGAGDGKTPVAVDTSLLPGCWVAVKDGVQQDWGVWFSNDKFGDSEANKLVKFWWRNGPADSLHRRETTYWYVGEGGAVYIWMWEGGRAITRLTRNRLAISSWWLESEIAVEEYQRMDSTPEIVE